MRLPDRLLVWLADIAAVWIFLVILVGFLNTLTGSALGCGRVWPLCNGRLVPGPTMQSLVEYGHRGFAGIAGVFVLVATVWAWRRYRGVPEVFWSALVGLGFVIIQSLLGALAVFQPESAPVMATHFGFALLAFAGLALLALVLHDLLRHPGPVVPRSVHAPATVTWWSWIAVTYTMALVYWGTLVAHLNAGPACSGWPLCNGQVWPGFHGLVGIIFVHRLGALVEGLIVCALWLATRRARVSRPDVYRTASVALVLVVLQIFSGAYVVLSHISVTADLIHVSLATCLFTVLAYAGLQTLPASPGFLRGMARQP